MRRIILFAAVICIGAAILVPNVRSADTPERPRGVPAIAWIPIHETLGFVIQHDVLKAVPAERQSAIRGYFVAHRGGTWRRLHVESEVMFHPVQSHP